MLDSTLTPITVQQIQIFLSVMETLNFSRSSVLLNMTQPGISKSLSKLEDELGFKLFERNTRNVTPTNAGRILYQEWKDILAAIQQGYHSARVSVTAQKSVLKIGSATSMDPDGRFWNLVTQYSTQFPKTQLVVEEITDMPLLCNYMREGLFDIIVVPQFACLDFDPAKYDARYAAMCNVQIAVMPGHELYERDTLTIEDILEQPVCLLDPSVNPQVLEWVRRIYQTSGHEPRIGNFYRSNYQLRKAFEAHNILLADSFWEQLPLADLKRIPLQGHYSGILCVYRRVNPKRSVLDFLELAEQSANQDLV